MWNDSFRIGDGEKISEEDAKPVYREYESECDIILTRELFNEIIPLFKIFYETNLLRNIVFTPKTVLEQTTSQYYFCHLDVKFIRNH